MTEFSRNHRSLHVPGRCFLLEVDEGSIGAFWSGENRQDLIASIQEDHRRAADEARPSGFNEDSYFEALSSARVRLVSDRTGRGMYIIEDNEVPEPLWQQYVLVLGEV